MVQFNLRIPALLQTSLAIVFFLFSCREPVKPKPKEIVKQPELLNPKTEEIIREALEYAAVNNNRIDDSLLLDEGEFVAYSYAKSNLARFWSNEKQWLRQGDSVFSFIANSERYGLFPNDYHFRNLSSIRFALQDSIRMNDAALWARADLLMTDAFVQICRHLKFGRLERDSTTMRADTLFDAPFVNSLIIQVKAGRSPREIFEFLEPRHEGYVNLKKALPAFLDSLDRTPYTYIDFPKTDSLLFLKQLQKRLFESSYIVFNTRPADTTEMKSAILKAQESLGLKEDGKAGPQLVKALNNTGREQFIRIAINMDRYKQLPETMPERYVWVNLPSYKMEVFDSGFAIIESKVIVGLPKTRTPVLTSEITNFITYPQWTVPFSIIFKEMLPRIQKNIEYLAKENLMVVDKYDSVIDPASIDWSLLNKRNFPYLIRQREGDDNSLGLIKFNFRNKYAVYLHDTNARSLFSRTNRAMSHGCVRVQNWRQLADFLVSEDTARYHPDTLSAWISRAEKHVVPVKMKIPVFLRYFTASTKEGKIVFFEDIYEDDKLLRNRYFAKKV